MKPLELRVACIALGIVSCCFVPKTKRGEKERERKRLKGKRWERFFGGKNATGNSRGRKTWQV